MGGAVGEAIAGGGVDEGRLEVVSASSAISKGGSSTSSVNILNCVSNSVGSARSPLSLLTALPVSPVLSCSPVSFSKSVPPVSFP